LDLTLHRLALYYLNSSFEGGRRASALAGLISRKRAVRLRGPLPKLLSRL